MKQTQSERLMGKRLKDLTKEERTIFYKLRERENCQNEEYKKKRQEDKKIWRKANIEKCRETCRKSHKRQRERYQQLKVENENLKKEIEKLKGGDAK